MTTAEDRDPSDRRAELRRAYRSLGYGELAAAAVFVWVAWIVPSSWASDADASVRISVIPLAVVLAQAGVYWLAARAWVKRAPMPRALASAYQAFRVLDPILLAVLAGVVIARRPDGRAAVLAGFFLAFALVEYVNYFVVRLSYPAGRWWPTVTQWRTPRLVADLRGR